MVMSKTIETPKINIMIIHHLDGKNVEHVTSFVYVGQRITQGEKCNVDSKKRIVLAINAFLNR